MEKLILKAKIMEQISTELDTWLEKKDSISNGYDYESELTLVARKVNTVILKQSIGELPKSRNLKKLQTTLGKVEVPKSHVLCNNTSKFGITSQLQDLLCYLGQGCVFDEASKLLQKTIGIEISTNQIKRVSEHYGEKLECFEKEIASETVIAPKLKSIEKDDAFYCMMDGGMVFTREEHTVHPNVLYHATIIDTYSIYHTIDLFVNPAWCMH